MSEQDNEEVFINLDLGGREFVATPENAELFTFIGKTVLATGDVIENSSRNHVFLRTGENDGETQVGTYIFKPELVQRLGVMMLNNGFPGTINQLKISECDENAYQQYVVQQVSVDEIDDFFPDEWSTDES